jgi:hypothetical protein
MLSFAFDEIFTSSNVFGVRKWKVQSRTLIYLPVNSSSEEIGHRRHYCISESTCHDSTINPHS